MNRILTSTQFIAAFCRLCILIICSFTLSALTWADELTLKNGDRVTGGVVRKDGKNLVIKTDQFGVATAPWDQVAAIMIEEPVTVILSDGRSVKGTLSTAEGKARIASDDTTIVVGLADIGAIRNADEQRAYERLLSPGWGQLWAGTATVGLAGASGNAETLTFTAAMNAARLTRTDKTTLTFSAIKGSAKVDGDSTETARAIRGGIAYDHSLNNPRLFFNIFNDYEYDKFQNLDLRFVIGGGIGFHAIKNEKSSLDLLAGGDYNHSKFSGSLRREVGEIYWGDEYNLRLGTAATLVQSLRIFREFSKSDARLNLDITLATKISKWLTWNLAVSDRYLNHPAPGRKTNDLLYTTGLGIAFSR
jgi:putative salt-induced outer membrane protein YdiY